MHERAGMSPVSEELRLDTESPAPGTRVVTVTGDVDLHSAPELRDLLGMLVDAGADLIVLDLSKTTFLDSMGLGVVLGTKKRLAATGGDLEIVVSTPEIQRLFEITMLDRIFEVHASRGDALARLAEGGSS